MENIKLASALRTVTSKMYKRLRKQMHTADSLSITAITTLSYLYQNTCHTPSELADLVKVKAQSMSEVLKHMNELGLINKTNAVDDKRKITVSLTEAGRKIVEQTRYERDDWLTDAISQNLSDDEKRQLTGAIALIDRLSDSK
ncbi:MAG: MarR family transcriptional regulator [Mucilaginibacter sp.]|uniref:MarR family winged helix-turn-helix transcriptional regulator n=1 Tax=Mucilaginibacter sp. TaxID=1882438 RepID=UPI0031A8FD46